MCNGLKLTHENYHIADLISNSSSNQQTETYLYYIEKKYLIVMNDSEWIV